jgi:aerobic-type carbon monoxide dehydrogenase small subunit (CoxS/CutS family)
VNTFSFGDNEVRTEIRFEPGQSIGAALLAAGHRSWRTTRRQGGPRGIFCGIGVCFDCVVIVNGRPGQRACLTEAQAGDLVRPQEGAGRGQLAV